MASAVALLVFAASVGYAARPGAPVHRAITIPGIVSFSGIFKHGILPWAHTGGAAQCANYGTPSINQRIRGKLAVAGIGGVFAGQFQLPSSRRHFPLQACELTHPRPLKLRTDDYYGYMFTVPKGWTDGTVLPGGFWGVATAQFHFQNIWGAPIAFELHTDHMTLALETGACRNLRSREPGCQWRSNADNPHGYPGNLGRRYVVWPPMRDGVWHEIIMHVHWATDRSGAIQVWHRVEGEEKWTRTVNLRGYPTVQWDVTRGCCFVNSVDKIGAYRGPANRPVSVWLGNFIIGTGLGAVAATMPGPTATPAVGR